jgi:hypothetical protein
MSMLAIGVGSAGEATINEAVCQAASITNKAII